MKSRMMLKPHSHVLGTMALLFGLTAGCGNSEDRYVPETDKARESLTAALDAWKNGAAGEEVKAGETAVKLIDARRQAGRVLESYEILDEVQGQQHRTFTVRLKLAGAEPGQTVYIVIGIDPLFVYRTEDYTQPQGM